MTMKRLIDVLMWPIEAWVETWRWFDDLDTRRDALGRALVWALRGMLVAVTALFIFLWIALPLGL